MTARRAPALTPLLLIAALSSCGGSGGGGGNTPQPQPPVVMPPPAPVTQTVGAAGGTINGPMGVSVTIPPNALGADTQITVAVDATGAPALPSAGLAIGPLISLTPHGTTFGAPITVSVPFDPTQVPAGASLTLIKTNAAGDAWQQLATGQTGNTLTAAATTFSYIGVRCCIDVVHIIDQPDDQTAFEGGFAFFRVEALRRGNNPTYQWFRNGLRMPGETNPEILIPRVRLSDDNSLYMARVTVLGASEDSRAARLLVTPLAPVIVNQPLDAQVVEGQLAQFFAASTSAVTQTVQWERRGAGATNFQALPNETAPALSFIAAAGDDGAQFRFCATNVTGTTCSRNALLSVIPTPVVPTISRQPQPVIVASGSSATFTVIAAGGGLSYEWQRAEAGAPFAPVAGASSASFTMSNVQPGDDGAEFRVRVFNSAGAILSSSALLTVRPNPGAAPVRLGGGSGHSIGLRGDGRLRAWGANASGQLGDGTFDVRNDAVDVIGLGNVATLSVGSGHALAIRADGEVWSWGLNNEGQLGSGTTTDRAIAQPVAGLATARAVSASHDDLAAYSLVALADGTVRAWGNNRWGQLGDGTVTNRLAPVEVGTLSEVVSVAAGYRHSLALRRDGSVWAWGTNNVGQLGNLTTAASLVPIAIPMPAPIVAISAGGDFSLALTDAGAVLSWGYNVSGALGDGTTETRLSPVFVPLPAPAVAVSAARNGHALALLADGRVFAWGTNFYGQLGLGTDTDRELLPQAVIAPLPASIVAIATGGNHSLALDADGNVWGWGNNFGGRLNDGTTVSQRETPVLVLNVNLN